MAISSDDQIQNCTIKLLYLFVKKNHGEKHVYALVVFYL